MNEPKKLAAEDLIKLINRAIEAGIDHGGDPGGPYCCELEKQKKSVVELAAFLGVGMRAEGTMLHDGEFSVSHYILDAGTEEQQND